MSGKRPDLVNPDKKFGDKSEYQFIKENWGSRKDFQYSYGLGMDPDGIEEGNLILEGFRRMDKNEREGKKESVFVEGENDGKKN